MTSNTAQIRPSTLARESHLHTFRTLEHLLDAAKGHAEANRIDEATILGWRLHPSMMPFRMQITITTDILRRGLCRLAEVEPEPFPDGEASFDDFKERIAKSRAVIARLSDTAIDADPDGTVTFKTGGEQVTMTRHAYLTRFIQPNIYFHTTTAYIILRQIGVPLGKQDYLLRDQ